MKDRRFIRAFLAISLAACSGASPRPNQGGENVLCPDGTASAGTTIRTVNCSTVVQYDGEDLETSIDIPGLANAGMKNADKVLRQVNDAATDAQIQFTQTCEMYNACGLTSAEYKERLDAAQRQFRDIREKVALLQASKGNPEVLRTTVTELYAKTVPRDIRERESLAVELVVQAKSSGDATPRVLRGGETLRTGDKLAFGVRVSQPAHVYVFQRQGAKKELTVLFPNAAFNSLGNPLPPGQLVRVPPQGGLFTLNDKDVGIENVYLAVSREPLPDLDAALLRASGEQPGSTDQVATAMVDLFAAGAPECQGQTRGLEVAEPSGCSSMSRGLTPTASDDADFFGDQSSLAAQTVPGDDVILRTFSFVHVQ